MKCYYCGMEVPNNQNYCLHCGSDQSAAPVQEPMPVEVDPVETEMEMLPVETAAKKPALSPSTAKKLATFLAAAEGEQEFPKIELWEPAKAPMLQLPTCRGLGKMFFLGLLTLGIYPMVIWSRIVTELNLAASRYDGKRTMPFFAMWLLAPVTLGIYPLVWIHKFCGRIHRELDRRTIGWEFGPRTFWLWGVLGSLILVGPFIFCHKLMVAMNKLNADYNMNG